MKIFLSIIICGLAICKISAQQEFYFCKNCGSKFNNMRTMTSTKCPRHPRGSNKGYHQLYEGSIKKIYICKNCGSKFNNLRTMTTAKCPKHPNGSNKGTHQPALQYFIPIPKTVYSPTRKLFILPIFLLLIRFSDAREIINIFYMVLKRTQQE